MEELDELGPPKKNSKRGCLIAVLVTVVLGIGGCVVGSCYVMGLGLEMVGEQIANDLADNPVILEHVGEIQEIEFNFTATGNEPSDDVLVFDVVGTKGNARLNVASDTVDDEQEVVTWGVLRLPNGDEHPLFADQGEAPR